MNAFFIHFSEFQYRCYYIVCCYMLTLVACCLEFQPLLNLTMTPLKRNSCGASLIATDLSEFWYTMIFFCGYISFFWGFPFLIYQIRCFIVPALIDLESRKIWGGPQDDQTPLVVMFIIADCVCGAVR